MNPLPYCYAYPHPAVTTDCVIFGFDGSQLNVLLIRRGVEPFKGPFPAVFSNPTKLQRQVRCANCTKKLVWSQPISSSSTPSLIPTAILAKE